MSHFIAPKISQLNVGISIKAVLYLISISESLLVEAALNQGFQLIHIAPECIQLRRHYMRRASFGI